ncbi:3-hydroxyacyl-ACP dehydratase FabZ [Xiamenia xianingshaonis]|uniref:3-hydroxyacyl-[acyl-carrier-protein] dehydratase n=1 Tax=Xiamenia xianingshaonis TaxID=2682776 RepID=A0A9E6STS5_9ACTN|nr:3-hydroxyacyl-ACP dehydratase FabZ [Xiamenia xianingshaonis]NGM17827.1 3-hydroxyacyl-ACP dehydratase FabZ [Eggerthellaceae bacterium zg-893]NHM14722.1 3-hydroxyacyl-ACP dehydratase FabZ [Xiamenia xianingshaonis]NHM16947.1 3-hydroxyacyl-ACP dehydratase FabZ [Xiamenia xianingshaonis]QTU83770.1 3-hydroxyacyl-ACP dehydratase FabZ [Xiamenia xianingshaonis]
MDIAFPCDQEAVKRILPHRPPFLWVSRVIACEPGVRAVAELDVDPTLPLFEGHFPDYPVLPGVIIMEALAQTAAIALLVDERFEGMLGLFAGIDKAKFRRQVRPGEVLSLEANIVRATKRMCAAEVRAYVDGELAAEAQQKYVMAPAAKPGP